MKSLRKLISIAISLSLLSVGAFAEPGTPVKSDVPAETKADDPPKHIQINPDSLRELLLKRNLSIRLELDNLYTAKANVNAAAAGLLPSLTLGAGVDSNPIAFAVKTISFLVPFFLPSNWLNFRVAKEQLKAEGLGYYAVKLNNLASIDSTYYTIVGNLEAQKVLRAQEVAVKDIYDFIMAKKKVGLATPADIAQAKSTYKTVQGQVSQADTAVKNELASVKLLLDLEPGTTIDVDLNHESATDAEGKSAQELADLVVKESPEYQQMTLLYQAAVAHMRSVEYSWIGSFTLGSSATNGANASFSNLKTGIGLNLSFVNFANVKLSEIAKDQLLDQQRLTAANQKYAIETTLNGLRAALDQYDYAVEAEQAARDLMDLMWAKYKANLEDLLHVVSAQQAITTAAATRIQAAINVDTERVALKRIMRSEDFAKINQCDLSRVGEVHGNLFKHIGSIFSNPKISVEQACGAMAEAILPAKN